MRPDTTTPIPPVLYVPCEEGSTADDARLTLRATQDGRRALLAYTALDRLVRCCGEAQPWALVPAAELDAATFDVVYLDLPVPEDLRVGAGR
jgi:hypothetical protein